VLYGIWTNKRAITRFCQTASLAAAAAVGLCGCGVVGEVQKLINQSNAVYEYNNSVDLLNNQRFKEALPMLERAVKLDPDSGMIRRAMGLSLIGVGRFADGLNQLKIARRKDPSDRSVFLTMANAYEKMGEFKKAIENYQAYKDGAPTEFTNDMAETVKQLRKQQNILEQIARASGGLPDSNYYAFATFESGVARWPIRSAPYRVYIEKPKSNQVRGYRTECDALVMRAFDAWSKASEGKIKFKEVSDAKRAEIRCWFVDNPKALNSPIEAGETLTMISIGQGLSSAKVKILTVDKHKNQPEGDSTILAVALHEVGHAIGLAGHSPNAHDIMYFSDVATGDNPALSSRDVATVKMLYASEKAYMPPKGSKLEKEASRIHDYNEHIKIYNEGISALNAKRYEDAIAKAQEYLSIVPTDARAKELIELSYDGLADQQIDKGNFNGASALLKQALAVESTGSHKRTRAYTKHKYDALMQKISAAGGN